MPSRRVLYGPCGGVYGFAAAMEKDRCGLSAGRVQSVAVRLVVEREVKLKRSCRKSSGKSMPARPRIW